MRPIGRLNDVEQGGSAMRQIVMKSARGFTLMEVLLAMLLLGTVLTGAVSLSTQGFAVRSDLAAQVTAVTETEQLLHVIKRIQEVESRPLPDMNLSRSQQPVASRLCIASGCSTQQMLGFLLAVQQCQYATNNAAAACVALRRRTEKVLGSAYAAVASNQSTAIELGMVVTARGAVVEAGYRLSNGQLAVVSRQVNAQVAF